MMQRGKVSHPETGEAGIQTQVLLKGRGVFLSLSTSVIFELGLQE